MSSSTLLDGNYSGTQAAGVFSSQNIFGAGAAGALPGQGGSTQGVPDTASVSSGPGGVIQSVTDYGNYAGSQPAHNQPLWWSWVAIAIGLGILAHFAHFHLRG